MTQKNSSLTKKSLKNSLKKKLTTIQMIEELTRQLSEEIESAVNSYGHWVDQDSGFAQFSVKDPETDKVYSAFIEGDGGTIFVDENQHELLIDPDGNPSHLDEGKISEALQTVKLMLQIEADSRNN